jgi:uncharacterized protein (TIGR02391 family)
MSINLETNIKPDLWSAVSENYESGHYKDAILDAMHYLSEVLRSKTGLDGDGTKLASGALGGNPPLLRINKLQTPTEKDIQSGVNFLVMGLYGAIRNPRSHEPIQDTKEDADAIIYFINHILKILDASEEAFTLESFIERIKDAYFVESSDYAELLVDEIPKNKILDTAIGIYRQKHDIDDAKLELVMDKILQALTETQTAQFLTVVSDELRSEAFYGEIRKTLQILRPNLWTRINPIAQLRIENMLIKAIGEGEIDDDGNCTTPGGSLGTWTSDYLEYFTLKTKSSQVLLNKLCSKNTSEQEYAVKFFLRVFVKIVEHPYYISECIDAMCKLVKDGNGVVKNYVLNASFPEQWKVELVAKLGEDFWDSVDDIPF